MMGKELQIAQDEIKELKEGIKFLWREFDTYRHQYEVLNKRMERWDARISSLETPFRVK